MNICFFHSAGPQSAARGSGPLLRQLRNAMGTSCPLAAPDLPAPENPQANEWLPIINSAVDSSTQDTVLIGHSLGGSLLLKSLARPIHSSPAITAAIIIASPFWGLPDWGHAGFALSDDELQRLAGLSTLMFFHCSDDSIVPISHMDHYQRHLPQAQYHRLSGCGHEFHAAGIAQIVAGICNSRNSRGLPAA